tara:strand:- start:279 stop:1145 length:867 start_codon:yes stop_codon:yes gene_type:complete
MRIFFLQSLATAWIFSVSLPAFALDDIYIQPPRSVEDSTHNYYLDLLNKVLPTDTRIITTQRSMAQKRSMQELNSGDLTLAWSGAISAREAVFLPIRVPLFAGLLGTRVPVIRKDALAQFDQIKTADDLKALIACQGDQWPDSDILEDNGYKVERVNKFELMYRMLRAGRCDYFPRGITEVYTEVDHQEDDLVMAYDRIILVYKFPMYFFVGKSNTELEQVLTEALYSYAASGELIEFMKNHETTRNVFPLSKYKDSLIFKLDNPSLPPLTPVNDDKLWLDLSFDIND